MSSGVAPYIPPGWSRFVVTVGGWTRLRVVLGSSTDQASIGSVETRTQYLTDYLRDEALTFLDGVGTQPFFLYFAPLAPHAPALPAPGDEGLFPAYRYRSRGYGEVDRSDKPAHIRNSPPLDVATQDEFHRNQLRSLQAVDRAVGALIDKLQALGKLANTVIVYTSDNGFLWGEHGLIRKVHPYDESIRVPLIVVVPGVVPREDASLVVSNVDVPTTIWHLAELPTATDGLNLLPLLHDSRLSWRPQGIFLESFVSNDFRKIWAGWRTREYKYVEYTTGEKELYDLTVDSYELENVVANAQYSTIVEGLAQSTASLKGLAITTEALPSGTVGLPYTFQMGAWGGTLPYAWSILQGTLPAGLTLDGLSGVIQGIPVSSDTQRVLFSVHDASIATQTQEPQRFVRRFFLVMVAPGLLHAEPVFSKDLTMPLDDEDEDDDEDPGSE